MDIIVHQKDAVHLVIECEKSIAKELNQYFTFYVPNYQYTPAYKKKVWDGQIRLFNLYGRTIYVGLLDYIKQFAKDRKYDLEIDSDNLLLMDEEKVSLEEFSDFISSLKLKLKPHNGIALQQLGDLVSTEENKDNLKMLLVKSCIYVAVTTIMIKAIYLSSKDMMNLKVN